MTLRCSAPFVLAALLSTTAAHAQPIDREKAREAWQRVPDLVAAMNIGSGSNVADVGAGYGFLAVRLAPIVGTGGRIYAVDSGENPLRTLRERVNDEHLENVTIIEGDQRNPHLPSAALDAIVVVNAYHEFAFSDEMLRHFGEALKAGGRLVMVEPVPDKPGQTRAEQITAHVINPETVVEDVTRAGFAVVRRDDRFVKNPDG